MKNLLLPFFLFISLSVFGQSNPLPTTQSLGDVPTTLVRGNVIQERGFTFRAFSDTSAANSFSPYLKTYPFIIIATTSDGLLWARNSSGTGWIPLGGGNSSSSGSFWGISGNYMQTVPPGYGIGTNSPDNLPIKTNNITRLIIPSAGVVSMSASTDSILVRDVNGNVGLAPKTAAGATSISSLTAATGTNSIDNLNYPQTWTNSTLSNNSALRLIGTSTAASGNLQTMLEVGHSNTANANSGQTTYGIQAYNKHTGTTSTNYSIHSWATGATTNIGIYGLANSGTTAIGGDFVASGAVTNIGGRFSGTEYGIIVPSGGGNVGIGTSTPAKIFHTVGTVRHASLGSAITDTTTYKPLVIDANGDVFPSTAWYGAGGGGGSPAGNNRNIQINNNGAFGAPGSDSLSYISNGLNNKGKYFVNSTQVLYLPDQANFVGTLILGNGGTSLSHSSGTEGQDNSVFGIGAGAALTIGSDNALFGYNNALSLTTGSQNVYLGSRAGMNATTSIEGTYLGTNAARANNSSYFTAIGSGAAVSCVDCNISTMTGTHVASNIRKSQFDSFYGVDICFNCDSTTKNTYMGGDINYYGYRGAENTAYGYRAFRFNKGDHNIVIGVENNLIPYNVSNALSIGNTIMGYKLTDRDSTVDLDAELSISGLPVTDQKFTIYTGEAGNAGLVVQLAASQTARAIDILDNGGTSQFGIKSNGQIDRYQGAPASDGEIFMGRSDIGTWAKGNITQGVGMKITNGTASITVDNKSQIQGADISSANNLSLGSDGYTFEITGNTQINLISSTNWVNGNRITLLFSGSPVVKNGQTTSGSNVTIVLSGGVDFSATSNDVLELVLCEIGGTQQWVERGRSVN